MTQPTDNPKPATIMDPDAITLGRIYAEALLDALPDPRLAEEFGQELRDLSQAIRNTSGCSAFLANPSISPSHRLAMVERIFGPFLSKPVASLLGVLANNHRLSALPTIAEQFHVLLNQKTGHVDVLVRSATPLNDEQHRSLANTLAKKFGVTPCITLCVDPELVGGLCVQMGDTIYDASVAGVLRRFRDKTKSDR